VNDRVAQLDARCNCRRKTGPENPLFGADVAVQQFSVKSGEASLVRDGADVAVQLGRRGAATCKSGCWSNLVATWTKRRLVFAFRRRCPAGSCSRWTSRTRTWISHAISFKHATVKDRTRVEAVIGSSGSVELAVDTGA